MLTCNTPQELLIGADSEYISDNKPYKYSRDGLYSHNYENNHSIRISFPMYPILVPKSGHQESKPVICCELKDYLK